MIWSPSAFDDVDAIADHIARDSPDQAALFVERLFQATERLRLFPHSGRVIPEIGQEDRREVVYGAYPIMYRVMGQEIWVTGVAHGARDWRP